MKLGIYSIYDLKTEMYHPPIYCHNGGHAMRVVGDMALGDGNVLGRHAEDYRLFDIGTFDDKDGSIVTYVNPKLVCELADLVTSLKEKTVRRINPRAQFEKGKNAESTAVCA